jgi:hypothetical protein
MLGSHGQVMNRSFDKFRLVNTYGAFGSVDTERYEAICPPVSRVMTTDDWIEIKGRSAALLLCALSSQVGLEYMIPWVSTSSSLSKTT